MVLDNTNNDKFSKNSIKCFFISVLLFFIAIILNILFVKFKIEILCLVGAFGLCALVLAATGLVFGILGSKNEVEDYIRCKRAILSNSILIGGYLIFYIFNIFRR